MRNSAFVGNKKTPMKSSSKLEAFEIEENFRMKTPNLKNKHTQSLQHREFGMNQNGFLDADGKGVDSHCFGRQEEYLKEKGIGKLNLSGISGISAISTKKDKTATKMDSARTVTTVSQSITCAKSKLTKKNGLSKDKITSSIKCQDTQNLLSNLMKINKELKSMNQFKVSLPQNEPTENFMADQNQNLPISSHRDHRNFQEINSARDHQVGESSKKKASGAKQGLSTSRTANFAEMSHHNSNNMYSPEGHDMLGRNFNIMNTQKINTNLSPNGYNTENSRNANSNSYASKPKAVEKPGDNPFVQIYKDYQKSREQAMAISSNVNS